MHMKKYIVMIAAVCMTVCTGRAEEVLVTATRTERGRTDLPASAEIIGRDRIESSNAANAGEIFKSVTGVNVQGSGFPGSRLKLNMRGLTPGLHTKRILVLVDGRRIHDPFQGTVEFALLSAGSIERIEVVRGPSSALYGSSAEAGVINIITRRGKSTPYTQLKAEGGSHNTQHYRISHGAKHGGSDYFVSGSHVQTDGHTDNSDGTDRDWAAQNVDGNIGWQVDDCSELRFFFGGYRGEGTDEESSRITERNYQALQFNRTWNRKSQPEFEARVYRNGDDTQYDWKYPGKGIYEMETIGGDARQSLWMTDRQFLTAGIESRQEKVDVRETSGNINENSTVTAGYLQDELVLSEQLRLTLGLRNDYNEDYGDEWSPRAGILLKPAGCLDIFASFNHAHRAPDMSDRFVRVEYMGTVFEGNPELEPEELDAFEVGFRHRAGNALESELTVFHNRLKDAFEFVLDGDGVFRTYNVTRVENTGAEISLKYRLPQSVSVYANYTYIDGEYDEFPANPAVQGNRLAYLAQDSAGLGVDITGPHDIVMSLIARYTGKRYGDDVNAADKEMDSYTTVDLHAKLPVTKTVALTADVYNLFDETYENYPSVGEPGMTAMGGIEAVF